MSYPNDTDDREPVRKHQFETTDGDSSGNPGTWSAEEVTDVLGDAHTPGVRKHEPTEKDAPDGSLQASVDGAVQKDFEDADGPSDDVAKERDQWGWFDWEAFEKEHERRNMSEHELLREIADSLTQLTGGSPIGKDADGVAGADVDAEDIAKSLAAMAGRSPDAVAGAGGSVGKPDAPDAPDGTDTPDAPADGEREGMGPFEDHAACVAHMDDVDAVDDPEAACDLVAANPDLAEQYDLEDGGIAAFMRELENPDAKSVLQDLQVTYVSGVGDPAQDSQWIMAKDAETDAADADWGVTAPLVVKADGGEREQQKAWAPVLIPNETDKQGDVIPADEIEKAAHQFLAEFRNIDTDHDLLSGRGAPIESWTLKEASTFTLPDGGESREYPAGTWMLGVEFADQAWKRVKSGDLTGFSIYGEAEEVPTEAFGADPEGAGA
jgi:hypothetical protein